MHDAVSREWRRIVTGVRGCLDPWYYLMVGSSCSSISLRKGQSCFQSQNKCTKNTLIDAMHPQRNVTIVPMFVPLNAATNSGHDSSPVSISPMAALSTNASTNLWCWMVPSADLKLILSGTTGSSVLSRIKTSDSSQTTGDALVLPWPVPKRGSSAAVGVCKYPVDGF